MAVLPHRTLLEELVRNGLWTIEETCRAFERKARELGEQASLSPRQLSRWMSGHVDKPRPVMQRVAEVFWGHSIEVLLGPPNAQDHKANQHPTAADPVAASGDMPYGRPPHMSVTGGAVGSSGVARTVVDSSHVGTSTEVELGRNVVRQRRRGTRQGAMDPSKDGLSGGSNEQYTDTSRKWDNVRRRTMISAITALAAGAVSPAVGLEALRHGFGHLADSDRDEWGEIAEEYGYRFYTTAPEDLIDQLRDDLTILQCLMTQRQGDRDLTRAAARLSIVLAAAFSAAGQRWRARRWWATAWDNAAASGDRETQVLSRSHEAVHALYEGQPMAKVLELADETINLAHGRASAGLAGALAGRAQALAVAGRISEAANAVRAVETVTARMPSAVTAASESFWGWPAHRMWHTQSYVFARIKRTADAMAAQDQALPLYSEVQGRLRAQVQMHRASCLIYNGDIGDGLRHAADALDALPVERRNAMLYEVVRQVVAVVPPPERHRTEYDELRDRIPALPRG